MSVLSENLKALRRSRFLTQSKLSDLLDNQISQASLAQYETGTRIPSLENIYILADFYNIPVSSLFVDTENAENTEIASVVSEMIGRDQSYGEAFRQMILLPQEDADTVVIVMKCINKSRNWEDRNE